MPAPRILHKSDVHPNKTVLEFESGSEDVSPALLHTAIDEMIEYYQDNQERLGRELGWMGIMLRRAEMLPVEDQARIEERITMYDDLFERDPKMQKWRAESIAKGKAQGIAEGLAKGEAKGLARGEAKGLAKG